jgi:thiamine biosynthesis lipoprotein
LLGTFVEIATTGRADVDVHAAIDAAFAAIAEVHALMSFHEHSSDVTRLNRESATRPVAVNTATYAVVEAAIALHHRSKGAFDVAVAPALQALGLLPCAVGEGRSKSCEGATTAAIELLPEQRIRFWHPGLTIDLGGIAKGFAVDRAITVLRECGMAAGLVNAGGDLAAFGPAESVHIRNPRDPSRSILRLAVENAALASSAPRFDPVRSAQALAMAVIDPATRAPAAACVAATVRAPTCMIADALTKVVMIAGADAAPVLEHYGAGAIMVAASGRIAITDDLHRAVSLAA